MKTNLKTTVLALALMAGVTGAFASDIVNAFSGTALVNYEWQQLDKDGNPIGSTTTTSTANPFPSDCTGSAETCAQGKVANSPGPYTVFYRYPAQ